MEHIKTIQLHQSQAKNTTISSAISQKEESDCMDAHKLEHGFYALLIRQRSNFCFSSLAGSPIHLVVLRLVSTMLLSVCQLEHLLDIKKAFTANVKSKMEAHANSKIDFVPVETLLSNETTTNNIKIKHN